MADQRDLIVMVADADAELAVHGLLRRAKSLNVRDISFVVRRYVKRDSGCYRDAHTFLRQFIRQFRNAVVMFDRHGSGAEARSREELERDVEQRLEQNGWRDRSAAIVLDPELEVWVWSDSPEVDQVLGWANRTPNLRAWLRQKALWEKTAAKPHDPKRAMLDALRAVRKPRSGGIFRQLAERVGFGRCTDPAFVKLKETLSRWFSPV